MYFLLNIGIFQPAMLVYQRAVYFDGYHHHNHRKGTRRFCKEPICFFCCSPFSREPSCFSSETDLSDLGYFDFGMYDSGKSFRMFNFYV